MARRGSAAVCFEVSHSNSTSWEMHQVIRKSWFLHLTMDFCPYGQSSQRHGVKQRTKISSGSIQCLLSQHRSFKIEEKPWRHVCPIFAQVLAVSKKGKTLRGCPKVWRHDSWWDLIALRSFPFYLPAYSVHFRWVAEVHHHEHKI